MSGGNKVLVIGSANVDVSVSVPVLPRPGETLSGNGSVISVGGKGANQAVAAAACGAQTEFVARIGADAFGQMVRDALAAREVGQREVKTVSGAGTGLAAIYVEDSGQNCIVVVAGANAGLSPAAVDAAGELIRDCDVLVLQNEIPPPAVEHAIDLAADAGKIVIWNPAPYRPVDLRRLAGGVRYLVPNETEAGYLWGRPVASIGDAERGALWLQGQGVGCVVITLGAQGCVIADASGVRHVAAPRVAAVDATGAGDAFVGCLAAALAGGCSRDDAVRRAVVYAALSTTRRGAQVSYATRQEFEAALAARG